MSRVINTNICNSSLFWFRIKCFHQPPENSFVFFIRVWTQVNFCVLLMFTDVYVHFLLALTSVPHAFLHRHTLSNIFSLVEQIYFSLWTVFPRWITHLQTSLVRADWLIWNIITFTANQDQLDLPIYGPRIESGKIDAILTGELSLEHSVLFKNCISKDFVSFIIQHEWVRKSCRWQSKFKCSDYNPCFSLLPRT